jgi:putative peptidoglycan lipid II flippase
MFWLMSKKRSQLLSRFSLVGGLTLVSRILGFARDAVIAWLLGAGPASDAFFLAFRLPDLMRKFFSDGLLTLSFVPVFTLCLIEKGSKSAFAMARSCFLSVALAGTILVIIGIVAAPLIVRVIAPGFLPGLHTYTLTVQLLRVMMPYLMIVLLLAVSMGILNSMGHFAAPGAGPIVFNLSIIVVALFFGSLFESPVLALGAGVVMGGLIQLFLQIPFLWAKGFAFFQRTPLVHPGLFDAGKKMLPSLVGAAGFQINLFAATVLASTLSTGSISYLYYAERLVQFPLALFAVSFSTVLLPELSKEKIGGSDSDVAHIFARSIKIVVAVALPAMFGLAVLAVPVVSLLFERGAFDRVCVTETASVLLIFTMGLWAFSGTRIFVSMFHAMGNTKTPLRASVLAIGFNLTVGWFFGQSMGYRGLALCVSVAGSINFLLLIPGIWAYIDRRLKKNIALWACRALFASAIMVGLVGYGVSLIPETISKFGLLVWVAGIIVLGVFVYAGVFVLTLKQGLGQILYELGEKQM